MLDDGTTLGYGLKELRERYINVFFEDLPSPPRWIVNKTHMAVFTNR
jgi:hypothetical protein